MVWSCRWIQFEVKAEDRNHSEATWLKKPWEAHEGNLTNDCVYLTTVWKTSREHCWKIHSSERKSYDMTHNSKVYKNYYSYLSPNNQRLNKSKLSKGTQTITKSCFEALQYICTVILSLKRVNEVQADQCGLKSFIMEQISEETCQLPISLNISHPLCLQGKRHEAFLTNVISPQVKSHWINSQT